MKLTKQVLRKLIKEEIGGSFLNSTSPSILPGANNHGRQYPGGKPHDNQTRTVIGIRAENETLGSAHKIVDGVEYVTSGEKDFKLFLEESDGFLRGHVEPAGEYTFNIKDGNLEWEGEVPNYVRQDSPLSDKILEISSERILQRNLHKNKR